MNELNRLQSSSRDTDLRRAITERPQFRIRKIDTDNPCPWWTRATQAEHREWINSPVPALIPWEELDWTTKWPAGQPVRLETEGVSHIAWVRLVDTHFGPRWLRPYGGVTDRRAHHVELTFRDPRLLWSDPWVTQLATAMLSAEFDQRCAWLREPDEETEPEMCLLLRTAREELIRPPSPQVNTAALPTISPPKRQRVWSAQEIEALRTHPSWIETVDLAPGR
jgi:hypothetical protein